MTPPRPGETGWRAPARLPGREARDGSPDGLAGADELTIARRAIFAPLGVGGRTDAVIQRITEAIRLGFISEGEQLPSESDLAAMLGVSTVTLREALAALRQQGLVETRRGRGGGSFVKRPGDPAPALLRARLRSLSATALRDLGDEHGAVFGAAAFLAAGRASADNVARMRLLADRVLAGGSLGARASADSRFHIEIAIASQSERLTRAEAALQAEVGDLLWYVLGDGEVPRRLDAEHRQLIDAIASEDEVGARVLAEEHVAANIRLLVDAHLELIDS
ncbi:MAG: FadR family transcriptional regulator [Thermoleophilia bacterium]|nr:FadR family transcriptional regulator [Thermoleophilia bacterium]